MVVDILPQPDRVARGAAAALLGETRARDAVAPLGARLGAGIEPEADVRETVVRALRAIGDPGAVHPLAEAAGRELEPDLAVAMAAAAFELASNGQDADLRRVADVLVGVMSDDSAPRAARRDAGDTLRAHVAFDSCCRDDAAATTWWRAHRDALTWRGLEHRFAAG